MNKENSELLNDSIKILQDCNNLLAKVSETCCMPARSPNMQEAQSLLDELIYAVKESSNDQEKTHKCIEFIGSFGSKIGFLNATCCTPTRESMYQNIFRNLVIVHGNLWGVLGHSHE